MCPYLYATPPVWQLVRSLDTDQVFPDATSLAASLVDLAYLTSYLNWYLSNRFGIKCAGAGCVYNTNFLKSCEVDSENIDGCFEAIPYSAVSNTKRFLVIICMKCKIYLFCDTHWPLAVDQFYHSQPNKQQLRSLGIICTQRYHSV
jgi:hypothetical protein